MEHYEVLNSGLANEKLQVGDSGDWDNAVKIEAK